VNDATTFAVLLIAGDWCSHRLIVVLVHWVAWWWLAWWVDRYTADNPTSNKFRWSDDRLTMTVVDLCKNNCTSADSSGSKDDLMVIQCNASNQHGYAFVNGYINVFGQHSVLEIFHRNNMICASW